MISSDLEQLQIDFVHWRLFEQVMFVCLFVCVGASVGDSKQDGSVTSYP